MMKFVIRTLDIFKQIAQQYIKEYPDGNIYWENAIKDIPDDFPITTVVSMATTIASDMTENDLAIMWLQQNTMGKWIPLYTPSGIYDQPTLRRIMFEDEGDAFRFVWHFEDI